MSELLSTNERRCAYRVRPASPDELNLSVLSKNRQRIRGEIANIAVGGALVRFESKNAPKRAIGDHITFAFASADRQADGNVLAKVISLSQDASEKIVQLTFEEDYEPLNLKRNELYELFNRRAVHRRHAETANEKFRATVPLSKGSDGSFQIYPVSILDISNTGVSFSVDKDTDKMLTVDKNIDQGLENHFELCLMLLRWEDARVYKFACTVRHRSTSDNAFIYGCECDWSAAIQPFAVADDFVSELLENPNDG